MKTLRYPELRPRGITFSRVHLGRLEKRNLFPKRRYLGLNTVVWVEDEIDAYVANALNQDQVREARIKRKAELAAEREAEAAAAGEEEEEAAATGRAA